MKKISTILLPFLLLLAGCTEKTQPTGVTLDSPATLNLINEAQQFNVELTVPGGQEDLEILIPEDAQGWLKNESSESATDGGKIILGFSAKANLLQEPREAVLTFSSKTYQDQVTVTVTQEAATVLVKWAADMKSNRIFPRWPNLYNPPMSNEEGSAEVMIYPRDLDWRINTIMGVEGQMLLRFGNRSGQDYSTGKLYLVIEEVATLVKDHFDLNQWYHIALTWKNGNVKVYVDGEMCAEVNNASFKINDRWSYEYDGKPRCWWFGYSFDENRSFDGLMTEFRMWKKAITPEILNEPMHFYQLDMEKYKDDLICYWKMTEGEGSEIENKADTGIVQGLSGELKVAKHLYDTVYRVHGESGITWVPVSLPAPAQEPAPASAGN